MISSSFAIDHFLAARPTQTLGCEDRMPDHPTNPRFHGFIQNPLHDLEPFRPWRCANEFAIPSKPGRKRLCEKSAGHVDPIFSKSSILIFLSRNCNRFPCYTQEHRLRRRSSAFTCANVPNRLCAAASHLLPLQGRKQRVEPPTTVGRSTIRRQKTYPVPQAQ